MKKTKHIILASIGLIGLTLMLTAVGVMAEKPRVRTLNRAVLKIDSLSCGGCFPTIYKGLASLEGYSGLGANLFRKLIAVDFSAPLTAEKISQKLSEIGYPGTLKTVDAISEKESFAYLDAKKTGFSSGGSGCCSGGARPARSSEAQGASGPKASPGGSCCALPDVSQSSKPL